MQSIFSQVENIKLEWEVACVMGLCRELGGEGRVGWRDKAAAQLLKPTELFRREPGAELIYKYYVIYGLVTLNCVWLLHRLFILILHIGVDQRGAPVIGLAL